MLASNIPDTERQGGKEPANSVSILHGAGAASVYPGTVLAAGMQ